ncbi:hypothetical protein HON36_05560 [Candidatus Parcubacteria bacterium]|jgi:ribonuclease PH|nr:hypothetical protein [Candidatus Parcubacteria bacterium]MBT7227933.1 hypothetical protein [Candidatus Parcubacteria bacterium]
MAAVNVRGFKNKEAIIVQDIPYGEDETLEVDSPVTLTGMTKVCVSKTRRIPFIMVEVTSVLLLNGTDSIFVDGNCLELLEI